jgi:1,3,6,8-tetrahydroxynaphthalene synthase
LVKAHGWNIEALDFFIVHAGGPRVLSELGAHLGLPPETFRYSRVALTERGNVASVVVLDALARFFEEGKVEHGARGLLAGFGPGVMAEIALGTWSEHH